MWDNELPSDALPIGYKALVEYFSIQCIPHYRWSYVSSKWQKREVRLKNYRLELHIYPPSYKLSNDPFKHLEFALKHEGVNFFILKEVLRHFSMKDIASYVSKKPLGRYRRLVWFLYEKFFQTKVPLLDLNKGDYIPLLDPKKYYCCKAQRSPRHRVADNLLGNDVFCPLVRKTPLLNEYENKNLNDSASNLTKQYDPQVIARAMRYLYTKETLSSWEIEREKPDKMRLSKFAHLLQKANILGNLSTNALINLQKEIVDPRFALESYRDFQNYIGEEPGLEQLIIHYICPKPEDVNTLMEGLLKCFERMITSKVNPVVIATILSFGFVYIHPFWDGNGRIHRFLIHYALAQSNFTPEGLIFPISATILHNTRDYDIVLESFSEPLSELITQYKVNDAGEMNVSQDTLPFYRYIDFTLLAEYLFRNVEKTIYTDFQQELKFLVEYDTIKYQMQQIIDMPDQRIDLFIKCVRQNGGSLSKRKQEAYFKMLTEEEVQQLEMIIHNNIKASS